MIENGAKREKKNKSLHWNFDLRAYPKINYLVKSKDVRFQRYLLGIAYGYCVFVGILAPIAALVPGWFWFPFLWNGSYKVYPTSKLAPAMQGLCVDYSLEGEHNGRPPLCLPDESWDILSTGRLTSRSTEDVHAVLKGIEYGKHKSGGIVVSVLARDIVDDMGSLRQNVESLVPFFSNVAVVVFENDSSDGTREAFKRWSQVVKGYEVELLECVEATDCRFGKQFRDNVGDFSHSSAIGDMHIYRQRIVDHLLASPKYKDYSHMIVLEPDIGVSLSPFGVLHTLGSMPDNPVASVGRQPYFPSLGTIITPYDFSAFAPVPTQYDERILAIHRWFCNLFPPGNRWRNECDCASQMRLIQMLAHDHPDAGFVPVESAFNGAVLYPLQLVREKHGKYDAGDDGQRCEHKGFHKSLQTDMYMNQKWDMKIDPSKPAGPSGMRSLKASMRMFWIPRLSNTILYMHVLVVGIFVWSLMTIGILLLYPLLSKVEPVQYLFMNENGRISSKKRNAIAKKRCGLGSVKLV